MFYILTLEGSAVIKIQSENQNLTSYKNVNSARVNLCIEN